MKELDHRDGAFLAQVQQRWKAFCVIFCISISPAIIFDRSLGTFGNVGAIFES
jgi:hypothetical protein